MGEKEDEEAREERDEEVDDEDADEWGGVAGGSLWNCRRGRGAAAGVNEDDASAAEEAEGEDGAP